MTTEITLEVPAIHCDSCVKTITQTLQELPSVVIAGANPQTKLVSLTFDQSAVSIAEIREALDEIGFSAED